jgi:hypothetical protein
MRIGNLWFSVFAIDSGTSSDTFADLYSSAGTLLTRSCDIALAFTVKPT